MIWTRPDDEILHARHPDKDQLEWYRIMPNLELDLHPIRGWIIGPDGVQEVM